MTPTPALLAAATTLLWIALLACAFAPLFGPSDRGVEALRLGAGSDGASVEQHGGKALHGAGLSTPAEVASRECNRSAGQ